MIRRPPRSTPFPTRRSSDLLALADAVSVAARVSERGHADLARPGAADVHADEPERASDGRVGAPAGAEEDRKSTRLNSSHGYISYAVFCLKKKKKITTALHR